MKVPTQNIRNFSIIAHIDHGKSTLADRLLELTGAIPPSKMRDQVLDTMDIERERGITIKLQAANMIYKAKDGQTYSLNLIDTPGHVDFSYEVSRSLVACEGALLVVDASQGIEAQTLAHGYLARDLGLKIIPIINKIDLPQAEPEKVKKQLIETFKIKPDEIILASAKEKIGTEEILEAIVKKIPAPRGEGSQNLRALIFDSNYDAYRGAIAYIRIFDGQIKPKDEIILMSSGKKFEVQEVGIFRPEPEPLEELSAGQVGYLVAGIRNIFDLRVGDTVTSAGQPAQQALPGYKKLKPMVFCGIFPLINDDYQNLRDALEKLSLNDSALFFEPENSLALGFGFRCGFLGILHLEITLERLKREYGLDLMATYPSVVYQVKKTNGEIIQVDNPARLPPPTEIAEIEEPIVQLTVLTPDKYVGNIMKLTQECRGEMADMTYLNIGRVKLTYLVPLSEILVEFFDRLKSVSQGYASMDYEIWGFQSADLIKLDILINKEPVDAFSSIVHKDKAYFRGRAMVAKLKEVIPRHMFEIPVQAAIGGKVIARETIKAMRKNVLAKCYGGDVTRKRKLLEKQKEGKKKMRSIGEVNIPQEAFLAVLKLEEEK